MSDFLARIKPRRSTVAGERPNANELRVGELAINTADGKLFTKHSDNIVKEITGTGTGSGGGGGGGGVDGEIEDLSNVIRRTGFVPDTAIPYWHINTFANQPPTTIPEFDAGLKDGWWMFTDDFPGIVDPVFYVYQSDLQGTQVDFTTLPVSGTFYVAWYNFNHLADIRDVAEDMVAVEYTNLTIRDNLSISFQLDMGWLEGIRDLGLDDDAIRAGRFVVYPPGEPVEDKPSLEDDILVVGSDGNWQPRPIKTSLLIDMPSESDLNSAQQTYERSKPPLLFDPAIGEFKVEHPEQLYRDRSYQNIHNTKNDLSFPLPELVFLGSNLDEYSNVVDIQQAHPDDDFYSIETPSWLRGVRFWKSPVPERIWINLKGKMGIWWDSSAYQSDINTANTIPNPTHERSDFRITANGVDHYVAITEKLSKVLTVAYDEGQITSDGELKRVLEIRVDIRFESCDLFPPQGQFCGVAFQMRLAEDGEVRYSIGSSLTSGHALEPYQQLNAPIGLTNPYPTEFYRGVWSFNEVVMWHGFSIQNDGYASNGYQCTYKKSLYDINAYEGLGVDGLGDVDDITLRNPGDTLRWNEERRVLEWDVFTQRDIFTDLDNASDGEVPTVVEYGDGKVLELQPIPRRLAQLEDVDTTPDSSAYLLQRQDESNAWVKIEDIESVNSVAGKTGAVTLETVDLDDVAPNKAKTAGSWVVTAGTAEDGEAYFDSDNDRLVLALETSEGVNFTDNANYLDASTPHTVAVKTLSGEILFEGDVDGPVDPRRGKFNLYLSDVSWVSALVVGEKLVLEFVRSDAANLAPESGQVLRYDGSNYRPATLSFYDLADAPDEVEGLSDSPHDGTQYARTDGAWTPVVHYDDSALDARVTTLESEVITLQGEVSALQGEVTTLQGEVTTLQGELANKIESAPVDGNAYVHQNGAWTLLTDVLTALGYQPGGGGPTPTPEPTPDIPETVNGGNFTTGEAGSVDLTVSGGDFTSGAAGSADELVDGGVFTSDVVIPETVDGGDFTTGASGSVDTEVSGGDFTTGTAGSADELVDGGVFTSDVVIPETVSGGDFTTGTGGSADVTLGGGDFTTGAAGPNDETVDGGAFAPESVSGGDFTSGGSAGPDTTYGGGDFTSGYSFGQNITLDGGVFTSGDGLIAGGGDFTSGGSGGSDVTYGGGDFATGTGGSQDITLDGGDFGGPAASGGDFTSGEGGDDDATYGAGNFTTGQASGDDVTLNGGDFSAEGGGDFTTGAIGGAAITYGAGDFSSGESSGAAVTLDGGDFSS